MDINSLNRDILNMMSLYLNEYPKYIDADMMAEMVKFCKDSEYAYRLLLSSSLGIDDSERYGEKAEILRDEYLPNMIHKLDEREYENNSYLKKIVFPSSASKNDWEFTTLSYDRYEAFVCDDFEKSFDGKLFPQIGFFENGFEYPCVKQNGREWMTVTPNEINTMKKPVSEAKGKVLTYGLGLGYFTYMAHIKPDVESITVVEIDTDVIDLFREYILPQFDYPEKILIINADCMEYAKHEKSHDFIFADVWHDVSDGLDMWMKLKMFERKDAKYSYWLEKTMKEYL